MKASGSRVTIDHTLGGAEVQIRALRNWPALVFLPVWLAGWTIGGILAIGSFLHRPQPFLGVWLLGWTFGEVLSVAAWSWIAFGREVLRVGEGVITLGKRVGVFQWTRRFSCQEVNTVRTAGPFGRPQSVDASISGPALNISIDYCGLSGGTVVFDYKGSAVRFGVALEEEEAREVAETLARFVRPPA